MTSADNTIKSSPYCSIAPIYDALMSHVNYHFWAHYISSVLNNEVDNPEYILECACGTGILASHLAEYGHQIYGFDKSPEMIAIANARYNDDRLFFIQAAFSDFPIEREYDAAICLYDSINYLMTGDEVIDFLERVKQALKPGGIFIFDICTRYNSNVHFRKYIDEGVIDGYKYFRFSDYSPISHIHINKFKLYKMDNPKEMYTENHTQFIYTMKQIRNFIKKSGFRLIAEYDDMTFNKAANRSFRIHYVVRKPL